MRRGAGFGICAGIFLCLYLSFGCMQSALRLERPVRSVAVIPFFIAMSSGGEKAFVRDPISGRSFVAGEIAPNAREELTNLLYNKLAAFPKLKIAPSKEVEEAARTENFQTDPINSGRKVGAVLGVEGVVLGWGFRYEERIGNSVSVERPASVSFVVHLVNVEDGSIRWTGRFQETQQPLSENILKLGSFLRRGGLWLKVENLASVGMDEILVSFPVIRVVEPAETYEGA